MCVVTKITAARRSVGNASVVGSVFIKDDSLYQSIGRPR
jgi:hypothetical protein